jgi:hypothetical protein
MALPPLANGAVQETFAESFPPEAAVTEVGAPGVAAKYLTLMAMVDGDLYSA